MRQLVIYHTLLTVYRVRATKEPEYLSKILCNESRFGKIIIQNTKLTLTQRSFTTRGASNWNSLPERIRKLETLSNFKDEIKCWIKKEVSRFLD